MPIHQKITEEYVVDRIIDYMENEKQGKGNGNWHAEKTRRADLHSHGADIVLVGGSRNSEYFIIECKVKSYAKSASSINRECWLNALGQIITRMDVKRFSMPKDKKHTIQINRAYKYGLGLYWEAAQVALRRIPKVIAIVLNLHIFSVNDDGEVKYFTPGKFGKTYDDSAF